MNSQGLSTSAVKDQVLEVIAKDFDLKFRPDFEYAADMRQARLVEPEHEAFNALDHLANALKLAEQGQPEDANLQLWQARRHLALGRIFAIEHQIVTTMYGILDVAARTVDRDNDVRNAQQKHATELEARFQNLMAIEVQPLNDVKLLERAVNELVQTIEELVGILAEFMGLALELASPKAVAAVL